MSNFGTKRPTLKDVNKDRFAFMFASMVGRKVTVKVRNMVCFEGLFSGSIMEKGEYTVLLKRARELPSESRLSGSMHEQMLIPGKEIISMTALDVPVEGLDNTTTEEKTKEFKTDSEINTRRFQSRGERHLESWADLKEDSGPAHDFELETHSAGWSSSNDQFVVAKQMGVVSTYREELYTTPLNFDTLTKEQRERAERIAKEIEGGRNYSSQEEGGDGDEEAMFSAVVGTGAYKKQPQHPADTASSWRRGGDDPAAAQRNSNTRLNALNLEPATVRPATAIDPKPTPPTPARPAPPPRPASPAGVSEMKGINALNLEPASVTRASAWDAKYKAGAGRPQAGGPAPVSQPTKKDFEIALAEIKSREHRGKVATVASGSKASTDAAAAAAAAAAGGSKFSFNPNASTFTPGGAGGPAAGPAASAAAPGAPALSIAITPGGSLSGTLKAANYDYYEPGSVPQPMPPPPMMMYPPGPFGMPMMPPPPQMAAPPAFAPLCDASQLERGSVSETVSRFMEKSSAASTSSSSWTVAGSGPSYREILGTLPVGIGPVMPPPMPPPMMMPPHMMGAPMYGMPAGYAPFFPPPPMGMPGGGGRRGGMPYGGGYPPQSGGGYRYRGGGSSGHAPSSSPPPSE